MDSVLNQPQAEPAPNVLIRPVFLVNRSVFMSHASYIRRILFGLLGTAHTSALVCPGSVDAETILCPSVESIQHPALQLPVFCIQNRNILLERLARFKPTVLHTFYPGQVRLAYHLSQTLDIPYIVTFHQPPSSWLRYTKPMLHAARLIAPSEAIEAQLRDAWPKLQDRIERVHLGAFVEQRCSCFSRPECMPGMIAVAPLKSLKTFAPFLNALRHLALDGHELTVALIGSGRAENAIRSHIRKLGLKSIVTVIPPIRPLRNIFSGADMYVHLSDEGAIDGQLLEAMATGLAVVGAPETTSGLLEDGETAMFWDPQDELSIYDRLKKLLSAREKTRQLALNAQAHLSQYNSVSGMVDRLVTTYTEAQQWHKQTRKMQTPASQPSQ